MTTAEEVKKTSPLMVFDYMLESGVLVIRILFLDEKFSEFIGKKANGKVKFFKTSEYPEITNANIEVTRNISDGSDNDKTTSNFYSVDEDIMLIPNKFSIKNTEYNHSCVYIFEEPTLRIATDLYSQILKKFIKLGEKFKAKNPNYVSSFDLTNEQMFRSEDNPFKVVWIGF